MSISANIKKQLPSYAAENSNNLTTSTNLKFNFLNSETRFHGVKYFEGFQWTTRNFKVFYQIFIEFQQFS